MSKNCFGYLLITCILLFNTTGAHAAADPTAELRKSRRSAANRDTLSWSVAFMNRMLNGSGEWFLNNESFHQPIKGVVNYAENEPVDTIVTRLDNLVKQDSALKLFSRKPEKIADRSRIPGYLSAEAIERQTETRRKTVEDSLRKHPVAIPPELIAAAMGKAPLVPEGNPMTLLAGLDSRLPAAFRSRYYRGWGMLNLPPDKSQADLDTLRSRLFNLSRQEYNDSVMAILKDSVTRKYRDDIAIQTSEEAASRKKSWLMARNRDALSAFNDYEVAKTNDSARVALGYLMFHAADDSTLVSLSNISGAKSRIWTARRPMQPRRIFLKNEQNDSLSVILYSTGKGELKMVIDDGVKLTRFSETQKKEITFSTRKPDGNLHKINLRQVDPLPWKLFGTGTVGFTQTSLSNWAKGGESSLSMLIIGRYTANYSKKGLKWENMAEYRLGIFNSKTRGLEKNDDKLEFQSRVGYSAFKKWFYSGETNFRTQIARGYKYPDKDHPISTFMAPAYLTFSLGLDYKPNKDFSMFLSPLTSKTTFVNDTALIDPTHYGLDAGKRRLWEAGAIVKMNWHYLLMENITYDTRAEIFNNYNYPFKKFNVDWEQTLVMQITQHISSRINTQVVYDYNVKFPVTDDTGAVISQKAKWQFKELFTIGFNYKF